MRETALVTCLVLSLAGHVLREPAVSTGSQKDRAADLAAIEKLRKQDIDVTIARDPVGLTDLWTDDAMRLGIGAPPEIGKAAIRASNDRQTADKNFKVVSYQPEVKDFVFLDGGWAVEWRTFTASFVAAPGAETTHVRGALLGVLKRLPDGNWKVFRGMGGVEPAK